jgi:hypothetical protein
MILIIEIVLICMLSYLHNNKDLAKNEIITNIIRDFIACNVLVVLSASFALITYYIVR